LSQVNRTFKYIEEPQKFPVCPSDKVGLKQSKSFGKEKRKLILNGLFSLSTQGKKMSSHVR
jgi:hypothetical protein